MSEAKKPDAAQAQWEVRIECGICEWIGEWTGKEVRASTQAYSLLTTPDRDEAQKLYESMVARDMRGKLPAPAERRPEPPRLDTSADELWMLQDVVIRAHGLITGLHVQTQTERIRRIHRLLDAAIKASPKMARILGRNGEAINELLAALDSAAERREDAPEQPGLYRLVKEATPGPWCMQEDPDDAERYSIYGKGKYVARDLRECDAELICHFWDVVTKQAAGLQSLRDRVAAIAKMTWSRREITWEYIEGFRDCKDRVLAALSETRETKGTK